jgi:hypothetical protein
MKSFLTRHSQRILGVLSGFDRVLFRGTLRSISYVKGLEIFLNANHILLKDFAAFAQRCTAQLAAHAEQIARKAGRPYRYLESSSVRKEDLAREIAERDGMTRGLVCVLYAVEPCKTFFIYRNRATKRLDLVARQGKCRFFYFYFLDREFGLMHIRVQSWFPFELQVCLNGRSYLARQMEREGIGFQQQGNCFTWIEDLPRAQVLLERLNTRDWIKTLAVLGRRVNPLLGSLLRGVNDYYWTIRQSECATDVMFRDPAALQEVYPRLCEHALAHFLSADVMRFLGRGPQGTAPTQVISSLRRGEEGVRVKHTVNENSVKMYDKAGCILRIETTINNPIRFQVLRKVTREGRPALAWQKMRKGVSDTKRRVEVSLAANGRYLDALAVVGEKTPSRRILDPVSQPVEKDRYRYRGLRPISPEEAEIFQAVLHGEHLPFGFSNRQLQTCLYPQPARDDADARRRSQFVSRKLRLLRAHGLVHRVSGKRLYRVSEKGHQVISTALIFRETDFALLEAKAA